MIDDSTTNDTHALRYERFTRVPWLDSRIYHVDGLNELNDVKGMTTRRPHLEYL